MLDAPRFLLVPVVLAMLAPRAASAQEPGPRPSRPAIVLPDEGPPPWGAPGVVYLHVETGAPRLEMRVFDGIMPSYNPGPRSRGRIVSRLVCAAPCDRIVDAREGARYFFSGPGLTPSDYFRLKDRSGPVTARVRAGSRSVLEAGMVVGMLGLASVFFGGLLLGVGLHAGLPDARATTVGGAVLLGNAPVALVVGGLLIERGNTRFRFSLPVPP